MSRFPVLFRKNSSGITIAIEIPDLNLVQDISPLSTRQIEQLEAKTAGLDEMLKAKYLEDLERLGSVRRLAEELILAHLSYLDKQDELLPTPNTLEYYDLPEYKLYAVRDESEIKPKQWLHQFAVIILADKTACLLEEGKLVKYNKQLLKIPLPQFSNADWQLLDQSITMPKLRTKANTQFQDALIEYVLQMAERPYRSPQDAWEYVTVNYVEKRKCHCCALVLPPVIYTTVFLEIATSSCVGINSMQSMYKTLYSLETEDAGTLALVSVSLATGFFIFQAFKNAAVRYLEESAKSIDDFFHVLRKCMCCRKKSLASAMARQDSSWGKTILLWAARVYVTLSTLSATNFNVNQDILNVFVSSPVVTDPSLEMPPKLVSVSQWILFGINQVNDPVAFGVVFLLWLNAVNALFSHQSALQAHLAKQTRTSHRLQTTSLSAPLLASQDKQSMPQFGVANNSFYEVKSDQQDEKNSYDDETENNESCTQKCFKRVATGWARVSRAVGGCVFFRSGQQNESVSVTADNRLNAHVSSP